MPLTAYQASRDAIDANKLHKRMMRELTRACLDFAMIDPNDHIMVCLSGGKDSYAMLDLLLTLRSRLNFHFDITAVNLDQKQPGFPEEVLPTYLRGLGVPFRIVEEDTYSIVKRLIPEGQTTCSLCSRLRRGILYRVASEIGATKIALGHHREDILETFFLNLFFNAQLKAMPAKLRSDDGRHTVIRPLAYIAEKDLERYSTLKQFPIIPCNLCGSQPNLQRNMAKQMLQQWEKQSPGRCQTIFNALSKITPSHLLDRRWYDFAKLQGLAPLTAHGDLSEVTIGSENTLAEEAVVQWLPMRDPA